MAIPPLSGSLPLDSLPSEQTPVDRADVFQSTPIVSDIATNRNAFIATDYSRTAVLLTAYIEGATIKVTYYHVIGAHRGRQSVTDITAIRDNVGIPVQKISKLELKIPNGFAMTWDPEATEGAVTGDAVTPAGFSPSNGDSFLYQAAEGQIGIFTVDSVEPMSYFNDRLHRIRFHLKNIGTDELVQLLEDRVKQAVVYDRRTYLGGSQTLLTESSYTLNLTLIQLRKILADFYYREFYDEALGSIVNPDGVYDPYLVEFLNNLIEFDTVHRRAQQLYTSVNLTYRFSIWSRLMENINLGVKDLCGFYELPIKRNTYLDIGITPLANRQFILLRPDQRGVALEDLPEEVEIDYVVPAAFYAANADGLSAFDLILYKAITTRTIEDVQSFIETYVDTYITLSKADQFYRIPLIIRLMDMARASLAPNIR